MGLRAAFSFVKSDVEGKVAYLEFEIWHVVVDSFLGLSKRIRFFDSVCNSEASLEFCSLLLCSPLGQTFIKALCWVFPASATVCPLSSGSRFVHFSWLRQRRTATFTTVCSTFLDAAVVRVTITTPCLLIG